MIVPLFSFLFFSFCTLVVDIYDCACVGDHFWGKNWYLFSRVGCDHPCVSFVFSCGYLGLFYYWWCAYVNMCVLLIVWGEVLFWDLCVSLSLFVSCFAFLYSLLCFGFLFCWCCGYLTPNADIVRFRCGGGAKLPTKCFWCFWSDFVLFWSTLISCTLAISLYMSESAW